MLKNKFKTFLIVALSLVGLIMIPILIVKAATYYRANHGATTTITERNRKIVNNSSYDYFVPNNTDTEWNAFNNKCTAGGLANVSCTANCTGPTCACSASDPVGTNCGGGYKYAECMVVMPSGCANSTNEPACSGIDTVTKQFANAVGYNEWPGGDPNDGETLTAWLYNNNPPTNPAADQCQNLIKYGYTDWYLPSYPQLQTLFTNRASAGGGFPSNDYWSSYQNDVNTAFTINMGNGSISTVTKTNSDLRYFRCIRNYCN